jgi:hypothetical protein
VQVKIIRRTGEKGVRSGAGEFYQQRLEAVELEYAPNRALRLTRDEVTYILAALQSDLEYHDGFIRLIDASGNG